MSAQREKKIREFEAETGKSARPITDRERELMRHALGITRSKESYRNYFNIGPNGPDFDTWNGLVEKGFATRRGPYESSGGTYYFHVTDAGRAAL